MARDRRTGEAPGARGAAFTAMVTAVSVIAMAVAGASSAALTPQQQIAKLKVELAAQKALVAQLRLQVASLQAQLRPAGSSSAGTATGSSANSFGSRSNPYPADTGVQLTGGWLMKVTGITPNANDQVAAENRFNSPPVAGRQFFMITVSITKAGTDSASFLDSRLRLVGASAIEYSTFRDSCGVIPNELPSSEVFPGGTLTGNVCWSVRSSDIGSLLMYDDRSSDRKYMKIG